MIPIHQILNRIRWDPAFDDAVFELGVFDRVAQRIERLALPGEFEVDKHRGLRIESPLGEAFQLPLHRIREVYRNGERIWQRPDPK